MNFGAEVDHVSVELVVREQVGVLAPSVCRLAYLPS